VNSKCKLSNPYGKGVLILACWLNNIEIEYQKYDYKCNIIHYKYIIIL